jgi:predicted AAA+ superfamily ATPase
MEQIIAKSNLLVQNQSLSPVRSLVDRIDWKDRLIGILGSRGTGKTTLLLQRLKREFGVGSQAVYITLDDIYFTENKLVDFVALFRQQGGKVLFIDEVHKYPEWAREIKNIYDFYKDVKIVFTGSSITDMLRQHADLSRRAVQYELTGLSFREYLNFTGTYQHEIVELSDVFKHHSEIALSIATRIKPLQHFNDYLQSGYYPFFLENKNTYILRLEQMVKMIVENDVRFIEGFDASNTRKIYQLLYILATNVPFKPNIAKLSGKTGIHRNTLVQYIYYLERARLINTLAAKGKSISTLQKPEKIFLENTNLHVALSQEKADKGSLRESFFLNQLVNAGHRVSLPLQGDFYINDSYTMEVGGRDKALSQIKNVKNSFVAADDIEAGALHKVPLWLFGFLY